MNHRSASILLLSTSTLAACAAQAPATKPADAEIAVIVARVLPKAESLDASAVEVTLEVDNPGDSAIQVSRVEYAVDTGDVSGTLKGSTSSAATIEAAQKASITFVQSIPFPEDADAYKAVLERGTIPANLEGVVVLGDGRKLPFARKGEVATPTLPTFIVFDAQAARYEEEGLDVTLFLRLINENVFPITIEAVRFTVFIDDKKIKSEQAALGQRLIQGGAEEYEVSTVLDEKALGKGRVKKILQAGKVGYKVTGKISLARVQIPFEHVAEIELGTSSDEE